jgi:hypothetical protein
LKLIFVYNANAGIAAGIMDSIHKTLSPGTYPCDLCAITYGAIRMKPEWKAWLQNQPFTAVFHHRPDFRAAYPTVDVELPTILIEHGGHIETLVAAPDFRATPSVSALIALIETRLAALSPAIP